jgi:hypothetical protein
MELIKIAGIAIGAAAIAAAVVVTAMAALRAFQMRSRRPH